jgi:2-amino-4-hydroxy-6-hydroxymethyldihydropteridine diphosphokinase
MARVWVSVGSNIDRERHVRAALHALRERFGDLQVSPIYETPAEGFEGDPFYNLVVGFETDVPPERLHVLLREIEDANGRKRGSEKFSARTLDIDALTYGEQVTDAGGKHLPRDEITRYAFVLKPLADVAGEQLHPELRHSYAQLWNDFSRVYTGELKEVVLPPESA